MIKPTTCDTKSCDNKEHIKNNLATRAIVIIHLEIEWTRLGQVSHQKLSPLSINRGLEEIQDIFFDKKVRP